MALVEVDVDLDEFEIQDVADHLIGQLDCLSYRKLQRLESSIKMLYPRLVEELNVKTIKIENVIDQMKYDLIVEGFNNKSLEEIEQFFKK